MTRFSIQRVRATSGALELIDRLVELQGPVAFFQSGDYTDGSPPLCLSAAELLPTDDDLKLGEIGGAPFYVDARQYEHGGSPIFVVDAAPGAAGRFSLEGLDELHFVTRMPDAAAAG